MVFVTGKIVYISYERLTSKTERDWYLSDLMASGYDVEYWDIGAVMALSAGQPTEVDRLYKRVVDELDTLRQMVTAAAAVNACFVMLFAYDATSAAIYRMLSRYNARMVFFYWGLMPTRQRRGLKLRRVLSQNPSEFLSKLFKRAIISFQQRMNQIRSFELVFAAGERQLALSHRARKVVPVNLVDYDRARAAQLPDVWRGKRYAVFLDINLAYQSDLVILGWRSVNPERYFQSLNRFFGEIETATGLKIVVAAHPKSNYGTGVFGDREVVSGLTPEMVKGAEFVISHHSTSISYAVIFSKPLVFIYTSEMEEIYSDSVIPVIHDLAEFLGAPHLNVDSSYDLKKIDFKGINRAQYDAYKYGYLTSRLTENISTQEIFLREIRSLILDVGEIRSYV